MSQSSRQAVNQATFGALANGVTLMRADFSDHVFERHSHDCYVIGATTHGIQRFRCKGRQYDSQAGDFVLFNPDEDHDGRPGTEEGFRYTIWYVPDEFVATGAWDDGQAARGSYFTRPHVTDRQMAEQFSLLSASLARSQAESLRAESLMRAFLRTMLNRHGERRQPDAVQPRIASAAALARVKDYIRNYYAHDMTVSDLAAVAGLSRAHLTRAFSAAYHMPPHVYLNAVRITQAQARIRRGMPLTMVALDCGFADQSHFTRRFKGGVGVTPSAWRAMYRASASGSGAPD
ncbi:AraC family transcriptional regulator [Massilia sp. HP4]|uniref:AraC family transcriptional regulator n=1 Tax=Massilia sp. HP4 TaxID=2562316 RepID=UPI0010C03C77|nr:AraC family transcriptional regulator [Massilia sp. HP4]